MSQQEQLPVAQAKAGRPEAWDTLFRRYQLPLFVYVSELVGDEQTALDIVQETFISAARHIGSLQHESKFGSWMFGIAHQRCIQQWRKAKSQLHDDASVDEMSNLLADADAAPDEWLIRQEDEAEFTRLLEQLPPVHRSVLLLHFIEEFSLEQIAEITGTQLGTVKSRMHYAKKALRKLMEAQ